MSLTIAICTYNRSELLKKAIDSLISQHNKIDNFELVIIDNNSTDDTKELIQGYLSDHPFIKYFIEYESGISSARNRALKETTTEYLGFIDDDAQAQSNFIKTALKIIKDNSPDVFGGPIFPYYLNEKPHWFLDQYETRIHNKKTGWTTNSSISASNLFLNLKIIKDIGKFNIQYGPKGNILNFGEETELLQRARLNNNTFYYDLELKVSHLVPSHKMNILYFLLVNYQMGKSNQRIKNMGEEGDIKSLLEYLDHFFLELNKTLTTDLSNTEKKTIETLAYNFNKIGQISQKLSDILKNEKGISPLELIELSKKNKKNITLKMYLKGMLSITKKYIQSLNQRAKHV